MDFVLLIGNESWFLDFGSSGLAGPAFATSFGQEWSDSVASYVLCGTFSEDLGRLAESDPALIAAVLKLRESAAGLRLREEVMRQIAASEGAEVRASVNAGLRSRLKTPCRAVFRVVKRSRRRAFFIGRDALDPSGLESKQRSKP